MPSWDNVEEVVDFAIRPKAHSMYPELFAASREGKGMPLHAYGRAHVRTVSELQFPPGKEDTDIRDLNRALKELCDDVTERSQVPVTIPLLEHDPEPLPNADQLRERALRARVDFVGYIAPEASGSTEPSAPDWLHTVVHETSRGGAGVSGRSPRHHWQPHELAHERSGDVFAKSIFRADSKPKTRRASRIKSMRAKHEDASAFLDLNDFLSNSVFKVDPKSESERKRREQEEVRQVREMERQRVWQEEERKRQQLLLSQEQERLRTLEQQRRQMRARQEAEALERRAAQQVEVVGAC
jgi:hypothetical protein